MKQVPGYSGYPASPTLAIGSHKALTYLPWSFIVRVKFCSWSMTQRDSPHTNFFFYFFLFYENWLVRRGCYFKCWSMFRNRLGFQHKLPWQQISMKSEAASGYWKPRAEPEVTLLRHWSDPVVQAQEPDSWLKPCVGKVLFYKSPSLRIYEKSHSDSKAGKKFHLATSFCNQVTNKHCRIKKVSSVTTLRSYEEMV